MSAAEALDTRPRHQHGAGRGQQGRQWRRDLAERGGIGPDGAVRGAAADSGCVVRVGCCTT